jgi:predicted ester cyclase
VEIPLPSALPGKEKDGMQTDNSANVALVQKLVDELLNQKKTKIARLLYATDCQGSTPDSSFRSLAELLYIFEGYSAAFPNFQINIDYLVADGNRVVLHYTFVGAHTGYWEGQPPTGLMLRVPCVMITHILHDRIVRQDLLWDSLAARRQIRNQLAWSHSTAVSRPIGSTQ